MTSGAQFRPERRAAAPKSLKYNCNAIGSSAVSFNRAACRFFARYCHAPSPVKSKDPTQLGMS
jgi:hypothetical protein